jgi:peptide/nickel transport system permease protein
MLKFALRRLLLLIPILFGLSIFLFVWVRALPGGPATALLGERSTPERVAQINRLYGFDRPLVSQYFSYMKRIVRLDFGQSITLRRDITKEMFRRFPATVELSAAAMLFAVGFGVPLCFVAAKRERTLADYGAQVVSLIGVSVPVFFLGPILKYIFALKLRVLPATGRLSPKIKLPHPTNFYLLDSIAAGDWSTFVDVVKHLVLPGIALGTIPLAIIARITRASVLEVLNDDYVRTARAKGLSPQVVNRRHVLRNALLPIVTVIGLQIGLLLSGAVLTETVFSWGGMGQFIAGSVLDKDYPVIQGGVLMFAIIFVLVNLLVDMLYAVIDPRIRVS